MCSRELKWRNWRDLYCLTKGKGWARYVDERRRSPYSLLSRAWEVPPATRCSPPTPPPPPANIASLNWPTQPNQTNLLFVKLGAIYDREKENMQKRTICQRHGE